MGGVLHEYQAGFGPKRGCIDNVYTMNEMYSKKRTIQLAFC